MEDDREFLESVSGIERPILKFILKANPDLAHKDLEFTKEFAAQLGKLAVVWAENYKTNPDITNETIQQLESWIQSNRK